jgi:hypothetical protein
LNTIARYLYRINIRRGATLHTLLSVSCLSSSLQVMSLSYLSFSLHRNILFCFSLTLSCLSVFVFISLSIFWFCHCWKSCSLFVSLPCLFYSLRGNVLSCLSFLLHSCLTIMLVLLAPNVCLMHSASPLSLFFLFICLFCLLFLFLGLCSTLSSDTATDYLLCFSAPSLIVNALKLHYASLMPLVSS